MAGMPSGVQMVAQSLRMLLVVWTGTAWFVALHPHFVCRMMTGGAVGEDDPPRALTRALRLGGALFGAGGLLLLLLPD